MIAGPYHPEAPTDHLSRQSMSPGHTGLGSSGRNQSNMLTGHAYQPHGFVTGFSPSVQSNRAAKANVSVSRLDGIEIRNVIPGNRLEIDVS